MAFYTPLGGGRFLSTEHTAGPWSAHSQHLGPPSALMVRALEALPSAAPMSIGRVAVEILGPVPVAELAVTAEVVRPGRSVELLRAELSADGRPVAVCSAWRMLHSDTTAVRTSGGDALPAPESARPTGRPAGWGPGYLDVMEWRAVVGDIGLPGPATVWARQRVDLVDGERPTGLQRLLVLADSGNGVSSELDPREWYFINTELTVHVHRPPLGEWMGMVAHSVIGTAGAGAAHTVLHDEEGEVARGAQALLVRRR
ncbi:thioesterase family protein [Actinokineospora guangxiensis]|uniref:Thioesterase family protein n=1 Tax=Actinokineospora guangxiensis TaxID=1490288 RepID=A0ABW0ESS1_9PSEU